METSRFQNLFRRRSRIEPPSIEQTVSFAAQSDTRIANRQIDSHSSIAVGPKEDEKDIPHIQSFDNSNITFSEGLGTYDWESVLRDKQKHIIDLYKLADYYSDADALIHGIIYHVYKPYTLCSDFVLSGANEKTQKIYRDYYERIHLREKLDSIALEYWKYGNVFVYIYDGVPITLPVNKCRIGNVALNGEPIVDFDCQSVYNEWKDKTYEVKENWIKDNKLEEYFKGYPPEVIAALNAHKPYAQLNPKYCKVLQCPKEGWHRYAVPFIASCLSALLKKELISKYEDAILNLGIRSFVHVKYGDPKNDILPNGPQLTEVRRIFAKAMSGFPLATTNNWATAEVIQPDLDDLFQFDKYKDVNNDILSAGGVSGIIVSGVSEDGSTFASAQVSMETCAARIEAAREEICLLMNKVNECIQEVLMETHAYNVKKVPQFSFAPLDMAGKKSLRETCLNLWERGVVSTDTMMSMHGFSIDKEREKRQAEKNDGSDDTFIPRDVMYAKTSTSSDEDESSDPTNNKETRGRKKLDDEDRKSDPDSARRSKQPKPSNPDGSGDGGADTV